MTGSRLHIGRYRQPTFVVVDTTDWRGPWRYENGVLDRELLPMGYIKDDTTYYYHTDELGNIRQVINSVTGGVVQETHYYPYGAPFGESTATVLSAKNGSAVSPYKFGGKEEVRVNDYQTLDFSARYYYRNLGIFTTPDPCQEDYPRTMPMLYCLANPVNLTDPSGCDTVRVNYVDNKWTISQPIVAEGNDVFIVNNGETTQIYTFSEGEYGNRLNALILNENDSETFGIYQLSGTTIAGFTLQPSVSQGAKPRRISRGTYSTYIGCGEKWNSYIGLSGNDATSGIRVHYGKNVRSTEGCVLLSTEYYLLNGAVNFNINDSRNAVWDYVKYLGAKKRIPNVPMPQRSKTRKRDKYIYSPNNRANNSFFIMK